MRTVEARAVTATIEKTVVEVMEAVGMVRVAVVEMASVWRWGRRDCGNDVGDSDGFGDVGGGNTRDGNNRDGKRWQGRGCGLCRFASFRIGLCQSTLVCVSPRWAVSIRIGALVHVGLCRSASALVCPCRHVAVYVGLCRSCLSESI